MKLYSIRHVALLLIVASISIAGIDASPSPDLEENGGTFVEMLTNAVDDNWDKLAKPLPLLVMAGAVQGGVWWLKEHCLRDKELARQFALENKRLASLSKSLGLLETVVNKFKDAEIKLLSDAQAAQSKQEEEQIKNRYQEVFAQRQVIEMKHRELVPKHTQLSQQVAQLEAKVRQEKKEIDESIIFVGMPRPSLFGQK